MIKTIIYLFIFYLFTNFAEDNLAGEISQNYCSNNETPVYLLEFVTRLQC